MYLRTSTFYLTVEEILSLFYANLSDFLSQTCPYPPTRYSQSFYVLESICISKTKIIHEFPPKTLLKKSLQFRLLECTFGHNLKEMLDSYFHVTCKNQTLLSHYFLEEKKTNYIFYWLKLIPVTEIFPRHDVCTGIW